MLATVLLFIHSNMKLYVPGCNMYVPGKFVSPPGGPLEWMQVFIFGKSADPSALLLTRVDCVSFDSDRNNGPDNVLSPMDVCGCIEVVYSNMPDYGQYSGFDIKTTAWVRELRWTIDFFVRVLVPLGRRFEKTPLPKINCVITVDGCLFGRDRKPETIILALTDFTFLSGSLSTSKSVEMTVQGAPPETPWMKIWITPRPQPKQIISLSPAERNKHQSLNVPIRSVALETGSA
jgi:hypothetical protein